MSKRVVKMCVALARQNDAYEWAMADALLQETDGSHNGSRGYKACAAELLEHLGIAIETRRLRHLRDVAEAFPPKRRRKDASIEHHIAAGSPEFLDAVIKFARSKEGTERGFKLEPKAIRRLRRFREKYK